MSERRFVIAEDPDEQFSFAIPESELKRRCEIIASILSGHSPGVRGWNEARDVLLYGDRKE